MQDPSGARAPSAKVGVVSAGFGDAARKLCVDDLPVGNYRVTVNAASFAEVLLGGLIRVSLICEVLVTLRLSTLWRSVNVQGQNSSITTQPIDLVSVVHPSAPWSENDLRYAATWCPKLCEYRATSLPGRSPGTV